MFVSYLYKQCNKESEALIYLCVCVCVGMYFQVCMSTVIQQ